jgi:hypothetical protein
MTIPGRETRGRVENVFFVNGYCQNAESQPCELLVQAGRLALRAARQFLQEPVAAHVPPARVDGELHRRGLARGESVIK